MRYDEPQLQEALAGAYVTGSLQGPARRRFETLMRTRPALRRRVEAWEDRLAPLDDETRPVQPPARVWRALKRRIAPQASDTESPAGGFWSSLAFWRTFGAVTACLALMLLGYAGYSVLERQDGQQVAESTAPQQIAPSYVAVLEDHAYTPVLVVTAFRGPWRMTVEPLRDLTPYAGKVFQVWAVERGTGTVRPLIQLTGSDVIEQRLGDVGWDAIKTAESLIVSVEDAGTTPEAPSGDAVFSGPCVNLKGPTET